MCIVKIQFVLWVAMEPVNFHIAQILFFLKILLIFVQIQQFGSHKKLSWGFKVGLLALPVNILLILKMGEVIPSGKYQENKTQTFLYRFLCVELILVADLKHLICIGLPLVNEKII